MKEKLFAAATCAPGAASQASHPPSPVVHVLGVAPEEFSITKHEETPPDSLISSPSMPELVLLDLDPAKTEDEWLNDTLQGKQAPAQPSKLKAECIVPSGKRKCVCAVLKTAHI